MTGPAVPSDEELRKVLCREIREASWARGIAMLDSDVAAFRDALLPVVRRYADQRAAEELRAQAAWLRRSNLQEIGGPMDVVRRFETYADALGREATT